MAKKLVTDELWEVIEPLLPEEPPKPEGGRPRIDDRAALTGILFVLKSGIPWEMLPQEMGCGSGMTCWRRLKEWREAGVWEPVHQKLLDRLEEADQIDWERASLDSASVPAAGETKRPERTRRTRAIRSDNLPIWARALLLGRFLVGYVLYVVGGNAAFGHDPPQPYGLPLFLAGIAVLVHLSVDLLVYFGYKLTKDRTEGNPKPHAKSYYESVRFIVNALLVTSGVVMGLLGDASSPKVLALVFLGLAVLFGLFNLNILIGALGEEYTIIENKPTQKTKSYITMHPLHQYLITVLLNLQFMAFLVGLTVVGFM